MLGGSVGESRGRHKKQFVHPRERVFERTLVEIISGPDFDALFY
jgi:hypothetical protein